MATICATPFKVPRLRATRLDECGVVVEGDCSTVVTDGTITVEIAREYEDREDFFKKNGDGVFCVKKTDPPILKWINVTWTFCNVDPDLVNLIAGEETLLDDATPPNVIGVRVSEGSAALVNVAIEVWTRTTGTACGAGQTCYGYLLFPWMIEGTISDLTIENGAADFIMTARTQSGSPWGVGPYTVQESAAVATLGDPLPFYQIVADIDHEEWILCTTLAPPVASCGCIALPLELAVVDSGVLTATATLPSGVDFPVFVDWGDLTPLTEYTVGPITHVYALAGSYDVSLYPGGISSGAYFADNVAIA
jgi:hypothetical protein